MLNASDKLSKKAKIVIFGIGLTISTKPKNGGLSLDNSNKENSY